MKRLFSVSVMAFILAACGQEALRKTFVFVGNPLVKGCFTSHPGVIDYKGKSYLSYHNTALSLDGYGPATGRRSICFTEIYYDQDGLIHLK